MNKNTFIAFALILATIFLFNSYETSKAKKLALKGNNSQGIQQQNQTAQQTVTETVKSQTAQQSFAPMDTNAIKENYGDTIWIENDKIVCGITELGAKIISIRMKEYGYDRIKPNLKEDKEQVDLVASKTYGGANLVVDGEEYDFKKFTRTDNTKNYKISKNEKLSITFTAISSQGNQIQKRFSFEGNSYKIGLEVESPTLAGKMMSLGWKGGITESEEYTGQPDKKNQNTYLNEQRKVHLFGGKTIEHLQMKKPEKKEETGSYQWAAITSKYFMIALVPDSMKDADVFIEGYKPEEHDDIVGHKRKVENINYSVSIKRAAEKQKEVFWIFAGPSKLEIIRSYKNSFEKVLFNGWDWFLWANVWFPFICEITLWLLSYINGIVHDYGIAIILLTILTRVITFPLSQSSMKSMNKMKLLQPKINALREKYKKNPKKMNEEIMAMYREEGVNPLNPGCLPMFLQMPILFSLFVVLQKAIELRGATTWMVPWVKDLSQPEILISLKQLGLSNVFPNGIPMYGYGIAIMPIAMAILTFFQNKMTIKDPNQKAMIYFMPIFMLVLFNNFPAGLVFYWTFSNALGIIQQYVLEKSMQKEMSISSVAKTNKPGKKVNK